MTEIDTSADAVERLAETLLFRGHHHQEKINHLLRRLHAERITASKTLRALAAERDRLREERDAITGKAVASAKKAVYGASADAYRAAAKLIASLAVDPVFGDRLTTDPMLAAAIHALNEIADRMNAAALAAEKEEGR